MPYAGLQPHRACQIVAHDNVGSGYLVSGDLVLTARHLVSDGNEVTARFVDDLGSAREIPGRVVWADQMHEGLDIAVVRLTESLGTVAPVSYGRLAGRTECEVMGFPLFKLRKVSPGRQYRDSHHAVATITPFSNRRSGTLELTVEPPGPNSHESPWQGISGAAVFAGGRLVGVLCEHHPDEGLNHLTARPVERWRNLGDQQRVAQLCEILRLPPTGALPQIGRPPVSPAASRGVPRDIATFTGRNEQLEQLDAAVNAAGGGVLAIHAVDGLAGVGKSAFAIHAVHRLVERFPDGAVFLPLHAHTAGVAPLTTEAALGALLLGDGLSPSELPSELAGREQMWRERTAGRQMLLVLDDAADAAQVRPLLPSSAESLVLITSRRRLAGLDDVVPISMGLLSSSDAAELFVATAGRPGLEPADPDVIRLIELCGHLPLAVTLTAARLRRHTSWTPADLIEELQTADSRLQGLSVPDQDQDRNVAVAFDRSYSDLSAAQQRLFRLLGAHPGVDFEPEAVAALLDSDVATARRLLMDLDEHRLLDETVARRRWRMHDLLREHAAALAARDADRTSALKRLLTFYHTGPGAHEGQGPDIEGFEAWQRLERENLLACIEHAASHGEDAALVDLTAAVAGLLVTQGPWPDALTLLSRSAEIAGRIGNRPSQAKALNQLGRFQVLCGEYVNAVHTHADALQLFRELGDRAGQASTFNDLGQIGSTCGDPDQAVQAHTSALQLFRELGDQLGQFSTLNKLGEAQLDAGDIAGAMRTHNEALELLQNRSNAGQPGVVSAIEDFTEMQLGQVDPASYDSDEAEAVIAEVLDTLRGLGDHFGQAHAFSKLGQLRSSRGEYAGAVQAHTDALQLYRDLEDRSGQAAALRQLGQAQLDAGNSAAAEKAFDEAQRLYRELGLPEV